MIPTSPINVCLSHHDTQSGFVECYPLGTERPNLDGFVKSPSVPRGAGLRVIFRHCGVRLCTPHASRFARLASGVFSCAVYRGDFLRSHQPSQSFAIADSDECLGVLDSSPSCRQARLRPNVLTVSAYTLFFPPKYSLRRIPL